MSLHSFLTEKQAAVVSECDDVIRISYSSGSARRPVLFFDNHVVKFNRRDIVEQGDTQAFVYAASKTSSGAPRVPEVYECFRWNRMEYLVMERVNHPTVESWINDRTISKTEAESRREIACQAVADALRWLFSLTPPAGADIGLIQGPYTRTVPGTRSWCGVSQSVLFGYDDGAPFRYPDGAALERHITKALSRRSRRAPPCKVEISNEPLKIVQCDIKPNHFLIDPETRQVTIIDFSCVCVFPSSFVAFAMYRDRKFVRGVNKYLNWKWTDNVIGLREATEIYCFSPNSTLGLDKNGFPVQKKKRPKLPVSSAKA